MKGVGGGTTENYDFTFSYSGLWINWITKKVGVTCVAHNLLYDRVLLEANGW